MWDAIKRQILFYSPQLRPNADLSPPLTAASMASANSRNARTLSLSVGGQSRLSISRAVIPSALWSASSRPGPLNLSMEVNSPGRLLCAERIFRIAGNVAVLNEHFKITVAHKNRNDIPMALYWEGWRALGSFFCKGSRKADSSGT